MPVIVRSCKVFNAEVLTSSGVATSQAIPIDAAESLALHLTGIDGVSPDVSFTYTLSADGSTFIAPQSPVTIGANKSAADIMDFAPECAREIKILATNNVTTNVTLTAYLCVQDLS
jgi:hypothetical protein